MNCPNCDNKFTPIKVKEIDLDQCAGCGAIWFDPGELEIYISDKKMKEKVLSRFKPDGSDFDEYCPVCDRIKLINGEIDNLKLSKCPQCNGCFVEKDQIIPPNGGSLAGDLLGEALIIAVFSLFD